METNGVSLFDQQPEPKKDRKTAFLLGGLAALGLAGALGVGFVIGGRGGDARKGAVEASAVNRTQNVPVSPTAQGQSGQHHQQPTGGAAASGGTGDAPSSSSGGTSGAGDTPGGTTEPPAPTNTPVPPADTPTEAPPADTPTEAPPTDTPTSTPTSTATPPAVPCPWCPDVDLVDPGILLIDIFPPAIDGVSYQACISSLHVYFETDEAADLWVVYNVDGGFAQVSPVQNGEAFEDDIALGAAFVTVTFQLHAKDANGNESVSPAYETFAGLCVPPDFVPDLDLGP